MNDGANKYLDGIADEPRVEAPFTTTLPPWEAGTQTNTKTGNCSPKGLELTNTHRRVLVTDLDLGITAGSINFNQSLSDVHIFNYNKVARWVHPRRCLADTGWV